MRPILAELHAASTAQQQYVDISPSLWKKLQGNNGKLSTFSFECLPTLTHAHVWLDPSPLAVSISFPQLNLDDPIRKDDKHRYLPKSIIVYARLSKQVSESQ